MSKTDKIYLLSYVVEYKVKTKVRNFEKQYHTENQCVAQQDCEIKSKLKETITKLK